MKTININGTEYTVEQLTKILEDAKKSSPMDEVYKFHNTTEEEFNKKYEGIESHIKAYAKEVLIVSFYNKGEKVDFSNSNQIKFYPYFKMDNFRFDYIAEFCLYSYVPARLCFIRKKDCEDAGEKFLNEYKESRTL